MTNNELCTQLSTLLTVKHCLLLCKYVWVCTLLSSSTFFHDFLWKIGRNRKWKLCYHWKRLWNNNRVEIHVWNPKGPWKLWMCNHSKPTTQPLIEVEKIPTCADSASFCSTARGDGYCDDNCNYADCNFDDGDCCGDDVDTLVCIECLCKE